METGQSTLDKLLREFEPNCASLEESYRKLRLRLVKFFSWKYCEDPESLADESITRLIKNISEGREIHANNPLSYVYAISTNVFREYLREKEKGEQLTQNWPYATHIVSSSDDLISCLQQCMASLPSEKLSLIEEYYQEKDDREPLALAHNLSMSALRLQVFRIKKELKKCIEKCLGKVLKA